MGCLRDFWDALGLIGILFVAPWRALLEFLFPKKKKSIKGEIILLTGAGQGLGKELALQLSELDPILVLWDINQETNDRVAAEIRAAGHSAYSYAVDVTNELEVISVANRVKEEVGDVSIVINNAGVFAGFSLLDLNSRKIRLTFDVNVISHFWIIQQFLPKMVETNRGHIVATASIAGYLGAGYATDYCASKHAVVGLMDSIAHEMKMMGKDKIKVTTVNPCIIQTGLLGTVKSRFPKLLPLLKPDAVAKRIIRGILREEEIVFVPLRVKYIIGTIKWLFKRRIQFKIHDFTGYGFEPAQTVNGAPKLKIEEV